jgi:hypothetical protein
MGLGELFSQNWFNLLSAVGIIGGLYFTAISFRSEIKSRRVSNLLILTQNHQRLWQDFNQHPELARVLDASADVSSKPVSRGEEDFVNMTIQHLSSVYQTMKSDLTFNPEGVERDIREFFSLPVPKAVWRKAKPLQNHDFASFVDSALK